MNTSTRTLANAIDFTKLSLAIKRLETLSDFKGQQVIEQLQDYEGLPFIDLLIKTGSDPDELKAQLYRLLQSGVVKTDDQFYTTEYSLNYGRLAAISAITKILVNN